MAGLLPQQIVIYDRRGQKQVPYDSCYTEQQAYMALKRCMKRHGRRCNARPAVASSLR